MSREDNPYAAPASDDRRRPFLPEIPGLPYAQFSRRAVACIVDVVGLNFPVMFIVVCLGKVYQVQIEHPLALIFAVQLCIIVLNLLYFSVLESSPMQATLGKRLVRIIVTDLAGNRISRSGAVGRTLAKAISILPFYAGFVMAAFTGKRQALHDLIAGTLVVNGLSGHGLFSPQNPKSKIPDSPSPGYHNQDFNRI